MKHRLAYSVVVLAALAAAASPLSAQAFQSVTQLDGFSASAITGEKPQSKVWTYDGYWWSIMPDGTGTRVRRLDGTSWTSVLTIASATDTHADVKVVGSVVHALLYRGPSSQLVSLEYVPATHTYQLWSVRTATVAVSLDAGVETATIDIDGNGRMWLASDNVSDINVRWSDSPYSTWSAPITIATGINSDDISVVTAFPDGNIGVLWSNQNTQRFGFKKHLKTDAPAVWLADEIPASQSALNIGAGMADDHLNIAMASDGTLYAAVKTSYDNGSNPELALLVRRPSGTWDNLYQVETSTGATRPIAVLDEQRGIVSVVYTNGGILYRQSSLGAISFGAPQTLISGSYNDATSTKQNYTSNLVVLASNATTTVSALAMSPSALTDSLAAHWSMNESTGATTLADSSTYGNTATFSGTPSPTFGSGKIANAITFTGGQNGTAPSSASLSVTGPITLAAWIRPTGVGAATQNLLKKANTTGTLTDGYELSLSSAGKVFVRFNQKTSADTYRLNSLTSYPVNNTAWMHVAATYDGTTARMYINGVLDSSKAFTTTIATNTLPVGVGAQSDNTTRFSGLMDDARIYRRALSASEILTLATTYTITASTGANGSISPPGVVGVATGGSQTFAITPNSGYQVADVLVNGSSVGAVTSYMFTNVTSNQTISATFSATATLFTISASTGANGTVSPLGAVSVAQGSNQTFTVTPNTWFMVSDVLVDGSSVGAVPSYTFNNVQANHTISASFTAAPDLVAHYALDEGSGSTLVDSSWYGNHAGTFAGPTWVTGVRGQALLLNGTSQYATAPDNNSLDLTSAITLAAWVKPSGTTTQNVLKKANTSGTTVNGYELSLASAGSAADQRAFVRFNQVASGDVLRVNAVTKYPADGNTWMHIAATYDGTTIKMYVNGVLENSLAASFTINANTLALGIGAQPNAASFVNGAVDDARIYNRALSASEIQALAALTHVIAASAGPNGSIAPSGSVIVSHAATQAFTITPDPNYHVADVTVDGGSAGAVTSYTFNNVTVDHTIAAAFAINTHTLTYTAGPNGTISGTTPQTVNHGANGALVTAVPNTGYHFTTWSDGVLTAARTDLNVTGDMSVTASFAINQYTLTYTAGPNGSISGTTPQTVSHGGNGTLVTAVPNAGHYFVAWSDGVLTAARTDLNVTADLSVTATFALSTYTLTYTAGANGSIVGTSPQTVPYLGSGTQVTATPNTGYHFVNWSDGILTAARTDAGVTADLSVTATFAINSYTLAYTAGANGTISGTTPQTVSHGGNGALVTAVPNTGYHFTTWSDGVLTAARTDLNVTGNISVTASFAINTYSLTYTAGANGTISGTTPQTVNHGANGTLVTAVPNSGYHFTTWSDGVLTAARTDLNVTGNISVTASFAIDTYTLTYTAGANGTISGTSPQTVNHGANGTLVTAVPNSGYHFTTWSDGVLTAARTDLNVTGNISVTASFAINTYQLAVSTTTGGTITAPVTSPVTVNHGAATTITAVASGGYSFTGWSVVTGTASIATPSALSTTATLTSGDAAVRANFSLNTHQLTVTSTAGGTITAPPTSPVTVGDGVATSITAVATVGYTFTGWTVVTGTASIATPSALSTTATLTVGDATVRANFTLNTYTLSYTAGPNGTISGTTPQTVNHGANGTLVTAVPNSGYHFTTWSDGVLTAARTDLNVTGNISVTASFAINTYQLTVSTTTGGTITAPVTSPATVNHGAATTITAVASGGYTFTGWSVVTGTASIATPSALSTTATLTGGNAEVRANFSPASDLVARYAMEEGSGSTLVDSSTYGNNATSVASPTWVTGVTGLALSLNGSTQYATAADQASLDISTAITLAAWVRPNGTTTQYVLKKAITTGTNQNGYELSLAAAGSAANQRPFVRFNQATKVDTLRVNALTQYPANGTTWMHIAATYDGTTIKMYVNGVLENSLAASFAIGTNNLALGVGAQSDGNSKFNGACDEARVYNRALSASEILALASFSHTITASAGANGAIAPSGAVVVNHGSNQTFTMTPAAGYHVQDVLVDAASVGAVASYTFTSVTADHAIAASFAINTYTLTYTAGANGTISGTTPQTVNHGANGTMVTAVPNAGFHFTTWSDGVLTAARTDLNVQANISVTASFAPNTYQLTVTSTTGGTITAPATSPVTVNHGVATTITAVATAGYAFTGWTVITGTASVATPSALSTTVTLTAGDAAVRANFTLSTFTITASAGANGSIAPSGAVVVAGGASQSFTITANSGYHILDVLVDGGTVGPVGSYTFNSVSANHTIAASFQLNGSGDLVAHYAMEEGSGTVLVDSSTYGNHGALTGGPTWVTGVKGKAMDFDGSTQYGLVPDAASLDLTNAITIATWVKPEQLATQYLVKKATNGGTNGYELSLSSSGSTWPNKVFFRFNQVTSGDTYRINSTSLYPTSGATWIHIAGTYDGTTMRLYVNGTQESSLATTIAIATNALGLGIGAQSDGGSKFMGQLDDVRIYNRALSGSEIAALASLVSHTIAASAGPNGAISPSGAVSVLDGGSQTFTITPNAGYGVADVQVDGSSVGAVTSYTFNSVITDHTISASFVPVVTAQVTFQEGMNGYAGTKDTHIRENAPDSAFGSLNEIGWDGQEGTGANTTKYALIRFDDIFGAGPGQIPTGAGIDSARLVYEVWDAGDSALVNEAAVDWLESVTYNTFGSTAGVQPADYAALVGGAQGTVGSRTMNVTSSLAAWSVTPALNKGWLFRFTGTNGTDLRSSEYATASVRPKLVAYYHISNLAPLQPVLVAPLNLAIGVPTSPSLQVTVTDPNSDHMTVNFYGRPVTGTPPNNYAVLGTNSSVTSGSITSVVWPGLSPVTAYEWYVTLDDGALLTTGPAWSFTTAGVVPVITSTAGTAGIVGQAYSYDVDASGIPTPTFALLTFPAGMTINAASGLIQWTPATAGDFNVSVRASNSAGSDTESYAIHVTEIPVITSTAVSAGLVGQLYSYDVNATGSPAPTYALLVFPAGMTINAATGLIQWTPATAGDFNVSVQATNSAGSDTQSYAIHVTEIPVITSTPVIAGVTGQLYSYDVNATGAPVPTYSLLVFPAGMTINSASGLIQWTPGASGDYNVSVRAANSAGSDTQSYAIHITTLPQIPVLISPPNASATSDNTPTFSWSSTAGGGGSYTLEYSTSPTFASGVVTVSSLSGTSYTVPGGSPLGDGLWYWHVQAKDATNQLSGFQVTPFVFTVDTQAPNVPTLLLPLNLAEIADNTPTFEWTSTAGTSGSYTLQYGVDSLFGSAITIADLLTETHTLAIPLGDGNYFWRVKAKDQVGLESGYQATPFKLTIHTAAPLPPLLIAPPNQSYTSHAYPTFIWTSSQPAAAAARGGSAQAADAKLAVTYRLQYSDDPSFQGPVAEVLLSETTYTVPTGLGLPRTNWYWRVEAISDVGSHSGFAIAYRFGVFLAGDQNFDKNITSSDIIYLVNFVFKGGPEPLPCTAVGDLNCDVRVTSSDIIYLINYVFKGGPPPCEVGDLIALGLWHCP